MRESFKKSAENARDWHTAEENFFHSNIPLAPFSNKRISDFNTNFKLFTEGIFILSELLHCEEAMRGGRHLTLLRKTDQTSEIFIYRLLLFSDPFHLWINIYIQSISSASSGGGNGNIPTLIKCFLPPLNSVSMEFRIKITSLVPASEAIKRNKKSGRREKNLFWLIQKPKVRRPW